MKTHHRYAARAGRVALVTLAAVLIATGCGRPGDSVSSGRSGGEGSLAFGDLLVKLPESSRATYRRTEQLGQGGEGEVAHFFVVEDAAVESSAQLLESLIRTLNAQGWVIEQKSTSFRDRTIIEVVGEHKDATGATDAIVNLYTLHDYLSYMGNEPRLNFDEGPIADDIAKKVSGVHAAVVLSFR